VQAKGLLLNMCRVTVYGQNAASNMENPADGRVFLISTSSIAHEAELKRQFDLPSFQRFR
jgi:hypothetical protein